MAEPAQQNDSHAPEAIARRLVRTNSISAASEDSQTAAEFINSQLRLEADAREALPYQFDTCTKPLGALRQSLFSCLTCSPPPKSSDEPYNPAGVCYSCSISCHGDHNLVELFCKRHFVCDCGTTRFSKSSPCTLRVDTKTGTKGGVHSEVPASGNRYNQNYRNRFCGCEEEYDSQQEKGTMFQCLGLGTVEDGGCGEDWWHPECILGIKREDFRKSIEADAEKKKESKIQSEIPLEAELAPIQEEAEEEDQVKADAVNQVAVESVNDDDDGDTPLPPGFPKEDTFEFLLCYKCVNAFPWIKQYANSVDGFLPPIYYNQKTIAGLAQPSNSGVSDIVSTAADASNGHDVSKKRKMSDDIMDFEGADSVKRQKSEDPSEILAAASTNTSFAQSSCKLKSLPPAPLGTFSLFLKDDFRDHLCRCAACFPILKKHPQLLEEEDTYEPPISENGDGQGAPSVGTGSLLDRGEAAFSNMDRVRAIEGAMVYAHLKDKVKSFLQPFADSGKAVSADDIKSYFETLRGDADAIRDARGGAAAGSGSRDDESGGDSSGGRKEQSGY